MTLTADSKKRVVVPGAEPGDVFAYEHTEQAIVLRRIYRASARRKRTKAEVLKAIRNWKSVPKIVGRNCGGSLGSHDFF
jgi:hypothetical protein